MVGIVRIELMSNVMIYEIFVCLIVIWLFVGW